MDNGDLSFRTYVDKGTAMYEKLYFFILIVLFILVLFSMLKLYKVRQRVEHIFLVLSIIFGIIFAFTMGPFQVPDEAAHFYRAYEISTGNLVSIKQNNVVGDYLPKSIKETTTYLEIASNTKLDIWKIKNALNMNLNRYNKIFYDFPTAALYSPIAYLPQSIGIFLGRIFNASPLLIMYIGRLLILVFTY